MSRTWDNVIENDAEPTGLSSLGLENHNLIQVDSGGNITVGTINGINISALAGSIPTQVTSYTQLSDTPNTLESITFSNHTLTITGTKGVYGILDFSPYLDNTNTDRFIEDVYPDPQDKSQILFERSNGSVFGTRIVTSSAWEDLSNNPFTEDADGNPLYNGNPITPDTVEWTTLEGNPFSEDVEGNLLYNGEEIKSSVYIGVPDYTEDTANYYYLGWSDTGLIRRQTKTSAISADYVGDPTAFTTNWANKMSLTFT